MKGSVVYLYAFDVANEIRTKQVQEVLSQKPVPYQIRVGAGAPRDVPIYSPLTITLRPRSCASSVGEIELRTSVKVFDVGALSITYEVPFETDALARLVPYHQLAVGGELLSVLAERLAAEVAANL